MTPDDTWQCDNGPVQRTEEKTLYRVSVLMDAETAALLCALGAEKNKDAQRQASAVSRQICYNAVAELFVLKVPAAKKCKQTDEINRKPPGELENVEQDPGPALSSNRTVHIFCHSFRLCLFRERWSSVFVNCGCFLAYPRITGVQLKMFAALWKLWCTINIIPAHTISAYTDRRKSCAPFRRTNYVWGTWDIEHREGHLR